jgi:tyrosyl-tRNA synthetase
MGKTAAGAVWLNADRLSPFDYFQYWRNTEDPDVGKFLRLFTDLPEAEIVRLAALQGAEINAAKIVLATEATALLHGRDAAEAAAHAASGGAEEGLPVIMLSAAELAAGLPAYALVARAFGLASNGEARRQIKGGGVRLNDTPITDEAQMIGAADVGQGARLSLGRKRQVKLQAG